MISNAIRKSARGEQCTLAIAGVCCGDPATVVACHLSSGGMGAKCSDLDVAFGCHACHAWVDQRQGDQSCRDWYLRRAHVRTLERLWELGILVVKGAK
jgi:hypothetical protein